MSIQKQIYSSDRNIINYEIDKNIYGSKKPILIFVHGAGGNLRAWDEERKILNKSKFKTLAIDLRGHGLSGRPHTINHYSLNKFSQDIYDVINTEKLKNFIIIGHCFGGMVTVNFHKLFPNLAHAYILIDSAPKGPQILKSFIRNNPFLVKLLNSRLHRKKETGQKFSPVNYEKFIGTGDWNIRRIYNDIVHTTFRSWIFTFQNLAKFNGIKILKNIHQPVLVINGEKDSIFRVPVAKKINKLVKNSQLHVIPDANHILVINNPEILSQYIANFANNF